MTHAQASAVNNTINTTTVGSQHISYYYTIIVFNRLDIIAFNRLAYGDCNGEICSSIERN